MHSFSTLIPTPGKHYSIIPLDRQLPIYCLTSDVENLKWQALLASTSTYKFSTKWVYHHTMP